MSKPKQILTKTAFKSFDKALKLGPARVISKIKKAELVGRGGAGFSTGMKWEFTRNAKGENKVLICNADEGEPGTFKDKFIINKNPDNIIEGIAIASYAIGAKRAYIYLREEYNYMKSKLDKTIKKYSSKLNKIGLKVDVFIGAGAYICGDETAIMNSIEGKRAEPRTKPPFPAIAGLYQLPTCINNVETLANVPIILTGKWKPLRLFSLSGSLNKPGLYELPEGIEAGELIKLGEPKEQIKALFFGCSGGCIPYNPKIKLDKATINQMGAMLGSCTIIAVGKSKSIPSICKCINDFFVHESCGGCTSCREGNFKMSHMINNLLNKNLKKENLKEMKKLAIFIKNTSFCPLGQSSQGHMLTALKYFKKEFEALCK